MFLPRDAIAVAGGAPVDFRRVAPRAAGVALPARGLAQIAEIAQISKTSMKWASARGRSSPPEFAQIAVICRRSPGRPINMWWSNFGRLENTKTANTEKGLHAGRSHKFLALRPLPTARRLARTDMNSNPWGIDLHQNTTESKNAFGNSANTENPEDAIACVVRRKGTSLTRIIRRRRCHRPGQRKLRKWRECQKTR